MFTANVIGNLGADAEVVRSNGSEFVTLRIAETRKWKDNNGNEQKETNWVDAILNKVDHPVLPFLKQGVKVFISGPAALRVYSSKKDRCMKAGITVSVRMIELCGGNSEDVPRELIDPETGTIHETKKYYWTNAPTKDMKKDEVRMLLDAKNHQYNMNKLGFVEPVAEPEIDNPENPATESENSQSA